MAEQTRMVAMIRRLLGWGLRLGARSAANATLADAIPRISPQGYIQVFNVTLPTTVYVRASHCRVTVRREAAAKVVLQASMHRAFGLELAAEQDNAGVYVVAKQKTVVGKLSRADFTIIVPAQCSLVFHLTPGDVVFQDIDGMMELPPQA
jgi:hypothetical protein